MSQHFDEHIKKRFGDYSPEVDSRIWERIAEKRKERKPGAVWSLLLHNRNRLLVLFLLLAGGSGAWLYINHFYSNQNQQQISGKTTTASGNTVSGNNNTTQQANTATATNTTSNDPSVEERNTTTTGNPASSSRISNTNTIYNSTAVPAVYEDPSARQAPSSSRNAANTFLKRKNTTRTGIQSPGIITKNTTGEEETDETEDAIPAGGTLLGRLSYAAEKVMAKRNAKSGPPIETPLVNFLPGCPSVEKNAAGNKKYFELYASADYGLRSFKDTGNSAYMQKRKESTKFTSGYSAGVRFTRVFNNSMSIRGGVNFSQINEKFSYSQGNIVQVTYIINANGDTTGSYTTVGTRVKTTQNKYRTIDIPLLIGYELGNGRFHANINAGAVVNVYSWQKGEVLGDSLKPVSITTGKGNSPYQFKTNAGLGITGGVSLYYKLNDRWHIMAEPYFRYNLSPMNKEGITLKQKYNTAGLRLGIRMDIP